MFDFLSPILQGFSVASGLVARLTERREELNVIGLFCDPYPSATHLHLKLASTRRIHVKGLRIWGHLVSTSFDGPFGASVELSVWVDPNSERERTFDVYVRPPLFGKEPIALEIDRGRNFVYGLRPVDVGASQDQGWPTPRADENGVIAERPLDAYDEFEKLTQLQRPR